MESPIHPRVDTYPTNGQNFWMQSTDPTMLVSSDHHCSQAKGETATLVFQADPNQEGRFRAVAIPYQPQIQSYETTNWGTSSYSPYPSPGLSYEIGGPVVAPSPYAMVNAQPMPRNYSTDSSYSDSSYVNSPVSAQNPFHTGQVGLSVAWPAQMSPYRYTTTSTSSSSSSHCSTSSEHSQKTVKGKASGNSKTPASRASFECRQCKRLFSRRSMRDEHERTHEENKSMVRCSVRGCNKLFGRQADVARHNRSAHLGDKHECRACKKEFNRSDIARRHEMQSCKTYKVMYLQMEQQKLPKSYRHLPM